MTGDTIVRTPSGAVRGVVEGGVRRWSGVPFAHVPDRFRRAVPAQWGGVFDATQWGPAPWQPLPAFDDPAAPFAEDCLNVVVWAPAEMTGPLPVLVWIYGGGFEQGSNASPLSRGDALAAAGDMIVVAVNYRIGALGWAELAHLGGPFAEASNLGLRDIVAGLQWVQSHIADFGGDPQRVTVMGESAGSFAACALLGVPHAVTLFSSLAAFSGCASRIVPMDQARGLGEDILSALDGDPMSASPEAWLDAQRRATPRDIGARNSARPRTLGVVDDSAVEHGLLTRHPLQAAREGIWAGKRLLVGTTRDEATFFPQPDDLTADALRADVVEWTNDPRAAAVVDAYLADGDPLADTRRRIITDWVYRLPTARLARAVADSGGSAHLSMVGRVDGRPAPHGVDVPGLFGRTLPTSDAGERARDAQITDAIRRFVRDEMSWTPLEPGASRARAATFGDASFDAGAAYDDVTARWHTIERP
ncbi:para-nitrobenzyl esterase [Microbacterium sp. AG1240]|uniref:carboxylesterase family protein n=1 Tax=Microbacterium sp. AG1240 TaxID=2183992 RepID=UPI000F1DC774|nr:carboxylesterase family protein [Microbacterium sp. AG1240]RKT36087.1 para-nitrobenzyl esterase [Microbacterium sp. AG1240]